MRWMLATLERQVNGWVPTGPVLPSADLSTAPELTTAKMLCNQVPK